MQVSKRELNRRSEKLTGSKLAGEGGGDNGRPQSNIYANRWIHEND